MGRSTQGGSSGGADFRINFDASSFVRAAATINRTGQIMQAAIAQTGMNIVRTQRLVDAALLGSVRSSAAMGAQFALLPGRISAVTAASLSMTQQLSRVSEEFSEAQLMAAQYNQMLERIGRTVGGARSIGRAAESLGMQHLLTPQMAARVAEVGPSSLRGAGVWGAGGGAGGRGGGSAAAAAGGLLNSPILQAFSTGGMLSGIAAAIGPLGVILFSLRQIFKIIGDIGRAAVGLVQPFVNLADELKIAQGMFTGFTGSLEGSVALMGQLREYAFETGLGFENTLEAAQAILPAIRRAGDSLSDMDRYLTLMRRLAVLNPRGTGGMSGAAIAISEAVASGGRDLRSLQQRFNISRDMLRSFINDAQGDVAGGLDAFLSNLGVTEEAANAISETFGASMRRIGDSIKYAGARVLQPFLDNIIVPLANAFADIAMKVADFADAFGTVADRVMQASGIRSVIEGLTSGDTKFGGAASFMLSANLGREIQTVSDLFRYLSDVMFQFISGMVSWVYILASAEPALTVALAKLEISLLTTVQGLSQLILQVSRFLPGGEGRALREAGFSLLMFSAAQIQVSREQIEAAGEQLDAARNWKAEMDQLIDEIRAGKITEKGAQESKFVKPEIDESGRRIADSFNRTNEIAERAVERAEMLDEYQQERLEMIEDHQQDEKEKLEDFLREKEQLEEDFRREQRQKAEDLARAIADVNAELEDKRRDILADADKRVREIEEDYREETIREEQDYLDEMRKMRREHNDNLKDAAARLDAVAFMEEMRRWARRKRDAAENHAKEKIERERQFRERIEEERQNVEERLALAEEEAREAIAKLNERYALERARAEEEFRIKMQRRQEEFDIETARREADFQEELRRRAAEFAQELAAFDAHSAQVLLKQSEHYGKMRTAQEEYQAEAEASYTAFLERLYNLTPQDDGAGAGGGGSGGGSVAETGDNGGTGTSEVIMRAGAGGSSGEPMLRRGNRAAGSHTNTGGSGSGSGASLLMNVNIGQVNGVDDLEDELVPRLESVVNRVIVSRLRGYRGSA